MHSSVYLLLVAVFLVFYCNCVSSINVTDDKDEICFNWNEVEQARASEPVTRRSLIIESIFKRCLKQLTYKEEVYKVPTNILALGEYVLDVTTTLTNTAKNGDGTNNGEFLAKMYYRTDTKNVGISMRQFNLFCDAYNADKLDILAQCSELITNFNLLTNHLRQWQILMRMSESDAMDLIVNNNKRLFNVNGYIILCQNIISITI